MDAYSLSVETGSDLKIAPGLSTLRRSQERFKLIGLLRGRISQQNTQQTEADDSNGPDCPHASPVKLESCLHGPRTEGSGKCPKRAGSKSGIRLVEVSMVESVEHIQTELETHTFADREILLNTDVPVVVTRRTQVRKIPRSIPEFPFRCLLEGRR